MVWIIGPRGLVLVFSHVLRDPPSLFSVWSKPHLDRWFFSDITCDFLLGTMPAFLHLGGLQL